MYRVSADGRDEFDPWSKPEERKLERYVRANGRPGYWAELAKDLNRSVRDVADRFCQMRDDGEFTGLPADGVLPNAKNKGPGVRGMFFSGSDETESSPIKNGDEAGSLHRSGAFEGMKLVPARERIQASRAVRNERPLPEFGRSESEGDCDVESDEGSWTFQPQ
jgi:hypothetical protein